MLVTLLKDVSLPHNGSKDTAPTGPPRVGNAGDTVELDEPTGRAYIKRKLAVAAAEGATAKQDKEAEGRKTKPENGPAKNKALTHDNLKSETK